MRKKTSAALLAILLVFAVLAGFCYGCSLQNRTNPNSLTSPEKEKMLEKAFYLTDFWFDSTLGVTMVDRRAVYDEKYNHLELVQSEADAANYGEDVIVAWPTEITEYILYTINKYISSEKIDMSQFSLPDTLTMDNIVHDWENVRSFLDSLNSSVRDYLLNQRPKQPENDSAT